MSAIVVLGVVVVVIVGLLLYMNYWRNNRVGLPDIDVFGKIINIHHKYNEYTLTIELEDGSVKDVVVFSKGAENIAVGTSYKISLSEGNGFMTPLKTYCVENIQLIGGD